MTDHNPARSAASGDTATTSRPNAMQADQTGHATPPLTWFLVGKTHADAEPQQFAVVTQPFRIGRSCDNELCIPDSTVSGHHAELVFADQSIFVRDLDSTNGTLLNGRALKVLTELRCGDILHFGAAMYTLHRATSQPTCDTVATDVIDDALAQAQFEKLIGKPAVRPWFQPIVSLADGAHLGYEVLGRSQLMGLETPEKMFRIAAQRSSSAELSRVCRSEGLRLAQAFDDDFQFYLNTDPSELETRELLDSLTSLRDEFPDLRIVLEVHESGVTSTTYLRALQRHLKDLGVGLAYDDFGAGQARLMELAEVPPDVLKFDVKLIQGLPHASAQHRRTIESLVRIVRELDVVPLAEGVERQIEADICRDLGFELVQGYLFGRPQPVKRWLENRATSRA
ncbi:Putative cyclic-di-GMP phosphodiesterase AdrB [Maioricimonas rarisocia]|uniref:Cyclic-di-GMP phosphodiesterase AdrB n=1 Tax=Maioricimonas rarisocia TaxID=2528026 RepID=A0A517Z4X0_9PLAN|nr:EAL domain-containing protein [Maioricimonas rarisocia]QDU37487.1 Putative cyclic-di-GMP phosphodiesterase AdrB [Maioricimonas rarisocia]